MESNKIRQKYIKFFIKNKHKVIDSSSLWPHDDPSVLLTTAGMQQLKPYFLGVKDAKKDFESTRLVSIQKCFRTSDIEEVGDAIHSTMFEMLGNFSIGDYFKDETIDLAWKFLTKELKLDKNKLWVTIFAGDKEISKDLEAEKYWKHYLPKDRIVGFGRNENWWGPAGDSGPCGPSSEIHYDFTSEPCAKGKKCLPNCNCGRFMELWNLVFTEFNMSKLGKIKNLPSKNIDTGMGFERLVLILQKGKNIYDTDLFKKIIEKINLDKNFGSTSDIEDEVRRRIIADHFKGSIFLLADGINFSNKEQGYILRRIFRRALDQYLYTNFNFELLIDEIINTYSKQYPLLIKRRDLIIERMDKELELYKKVLDVNIDEVVKKMKGLKKSDEKDQNKVPSIRELTASQAFVLFSTYGLSPERIKKKGYKFNFDEFNKEVEKHQKLSKKGAHKKFGGHGLNSGEASSADLKQMTKYHTATHLLHQALRDILGDHVRQQGSDINPERLRFDFEHPVKLTDEEKGRIEELINSEISKNHIVMKEEMSYDKALKSGALAFFKDKYPKNVTVYRIGDFSKEICGGPHVKTLKDIGKFKIISEKSSSSGIRRIKAIFE
ncbi:MAG: alanine--tRNA ligase [Candidatus Kerfeldbacteria bacterium]